jgi:hypothetical protein
MYKTRTITVMALSTAVISLLVLNEGSANYLDGGVGVTTFPSSNPNRILFTDNVRPGEYGVTSRSSYNNAINNSGQNLDRQWGFPIAYDTRGNAPGRGSWLFGSTYKWSNNGSSYSTKTYFNKPFTDAGNEPSGVNSDFVIRQNLQLTDEPIACGKNTSCGAITRSVGTSSCRNLKMYATGELANEFLSVVSNSTLTAGIEGGWSQCQETSSSHSCTPPVVGYPSLTYATREMTTKFGRQVIVSTRNWPTGSTPRVGTQGWIDACRAAGGSIDAQGACKAPSDITTFKMYSESAGRWPIRTAPIYLSCRTIKG